MNSIYNYQSPRQFVLERIGDLQKQDASLSVRQLALRMGFKSHALLVMLLQGKRPLRVKHAASLAKGLGLSSHERLYLQALIQFDSAEDLDEKQLCKMWLSELHPEHEVKTRQLEQFELVSNWIHMAILSMAELKDFNPAPEAIAKRLGPKVTANEVRSALERLKTLRLIKYTGDGRFQPTSTRVTTHDDIKSLGVRRYHRDVMALATEAIDKVPLDQREFQAFAMSIPHERIPLAKNLIRKFRGQFAKAMGRDAGDEVYQFNIQFFQLTENPLRAVRVEGEGVDTDGIKNSKGEIIC